MNKICPRCGGIAEYSAYYGTIICTRCSWESEKLGSQTKKYNSFRPSNHYLNLNRKEEKENKKSFVML